MPKLKKCCSSLNQNLGIRGQNAMHVFNRSQTNQVFGPGVTSFKTHQTLKVAAAVKEINDNLREIIPNGK